MQRILRRYAHPLETLPGIRATMLDAFESIGLRPAKSRAGNATRPPPPANALSTPPRKPAAIRTRRRSTGKKEELEWIEAVKSGWIAFRSTGTDRNPPNSLRSLDPTAWAA